MDKPISFRVCDFSEQIFTTQEPYYAKVYSAVMHVDGLVYQHKEALNERFMPPLSVIRSKAWLALLEQITKDQAK